MDFLLWIRFIHETRIALDAAFQFATIWNLVSDLWIIRTVTANNATDELSITHISGNSGLNYGESTKTGAS